MSSNKASLVTKLVNASVPAFVWLLAGIYFLAFSFSIRVPLTLDKFDPGPAFLPQLLGGGLLLGGHALELLAPGRRLLAQRALPRRPGAGRGHRRVRAGQGGVDLVSAGKRCAK